MSRSWSHTIVAYTADELVAWEQHEEKLNADEKSRAFFERLYAPIGIVYWSDCSAPRCRARPEYRVTYRYVTGRAGRVSYAERDYCADHAGKFASKNGLELPPSNLAH